MCSTKPMGGSKGHPMQLMPSVPAPPRMCQSLGFPPGPIRGWIPFPSAASTLGAAFGHLRGNRRPHPPPQPEAGAAWGVRGGRAAGGDDKRREAVVYNRARPPGDGGLFGDPGNLTTGEDWGENGIQARAQHARTIQGRSSSFECTYLRADAVV